jgi:site-specific DNA-methyltransferase (adenine-specific)
MEVCGVNIDFNKQNGFFINCDCMEGMKEFPDKYFDLAIVDPPYGGVTQGGYMTNQMGGGVAKNRNDYHLSLWQCDRPDKTYFDELMRVSKAQIIWGGNYYASLLPDSQCWIVWDKEKPEGVSFADCELAWTSFNLASRMFKFAWNGMIQGDMKHKEYKIHPTQKPVALYEWLLNRYAKDGDIILDTHVGSASSLIACRNTNHKYVGFELDKTYYKLAKKRLEQETAQMNIFDYMK